MISVKEYQQFCKEGWKPGNDLSVFALGLGGECGEVLDIIKKSMRDQIPVNINHLVEELGDVLWYVANLCTQYNLDLQNVIENNVSKLKKRYNLSI